MEFYYNNTITSDYMNKIHMENEKSNNIRLSPRDIYSYSNLIPFLYVCPTVNATKRKYNIQVQRYYNFVDIEIFKLFYILCIFHILNDVNTIFVYRFLFIF